MLNHWEKAWAIIKPISIKDKMCASQYNIVSAIKIRDENKF